jgi:aminomethyltransferase
MLKKKKDFIKRIVAMLETPLHDWHIAHKAKMAPFAGWDMPIQYEEGILAEHAHTRSCASVFDICHMAQFMVKGDTVTELLKKAVGKCRYGFLLTDEGTVIDDLIVYHLAEHHYFLVVNAGCAEKDFDTLVKRLGKDNIENISPKSGKIDLQGPKSLEVLEAVTKQNFHDLKYFSFTHIEYKGFTILVSRTGYTGELGYELYCPKEAVLTLWEDLLAHELVKPAGLGARAAP